LLNALTIDLEDWFQVSNVEHIIPFGAWDDCQPRLVANTCRLLGVLAEADVRATFFVLGWNAERFPALVQEVAAAGHEIASHGYAHRLVFDQAPEEFALDLRRANEAIGDACGARPRAYRAPSFSITAKSTWAFDVLASQGFTVDSSVFPIYHERYGFQQAPRLPFRVRASSSADLVEAPPSTLRLLGRNYPFAGGAYFRILPYGVARQFCQHLNNRGEPVIFYVHPWELDSGIPRFRLSPFRQLRSYVNLDQTEVRLRQLLRDFQFGPLSAVVASQADLIQWDPSAEVRGIHAGSSDVTPVPRQWSQ
jgi:polysaccharide deacetylase family protein (PEP-CTERM system associated)